LHMLWCQSAQNIGLSNRKLKSALKCTIRPQCTPVKDKHDGQTNIMAIARRFVLTNAWSAKNNHGVRLVRYRCNSLWPEGFVEVTVFLHTSSFRHQDSDTTQEIIRYNTKTKQKIKIKMMVGLITMI